MTDVAAARDGSFILRDLIPYIFQSMMLTQISSGKKGSTHKANIPAYLSVFCSGNSVDIAFRSLTFANQFGVDRLDLATGNEVWSKAYVTPSNSVAINRIISIRDSVYLFMYNYIQYAAAPFTNLVVKLDTLGNFYAAQTLGADPINETENPPTVTLTSDGNFALVAARVTVAGQQRLP